MICKKGYDVRVLSSRAGWYVGTLDEEGMPKCRISGYSDKFMAVEEFALTRMNNCMENEWCNETGNCFK